MLLLVVFLSRSVLVLEENNFVEIGVGGQLRQQQMCILVDAAKSAVHLRRRRRGGRSHTRRGLLPTARRSGRMAVRRRRTRRRRRGGGGRRRREGMSVVTDGDRSLPERGRRRGGGVGPTRARAGHQILHQLPRLGQQLHQVGGEGLRQAVLCVVLLRRREELLHGVVGVIQTPEIFGDSVLRIRTNHQPNLIRSFKDEYATTDARGRGTDCIRAVDARVQELPVIKHGHGIRTGAETIVRRDGVIAIAIVIVTVVIVEGLTLAGESCQGRRHDTRGRRTCSIVGIVVAASAERLAEGERRRWADGTHPLGRREHGGDDIRVGVVAPEQRLGQLQRGGTGIALVELLLLQLEGQFRHVALDVQAAGRAAAGQTRLATVAARRDDGGVVVHHHTRRTVRVRGGGGA